jgi:hypothetical protein
MAGNVAYGGSQALLVPVCVDAYTATTGAAPCRPQTVMSEAHMTKEERRIVQLVRDLDLERHKRVQAERQAVALRAVIARLKAQRAVKQEPDQVRPC